MSKPETASEFWERMTGRNPTDDGVLSQDDFNKQAGITSFGGGVLTPQEFADRFVNPTGE
ncbi:MAG: hypothetical protein ACYTG0_10930 [Planctomycetota bacterium]|jgi:hypothetical protein